MPQTAPTMARDPNTGLRENVESRCDVTPIPGRIAMYTSGWPKNQNKCCHKSGEPPECGCKRSLTTSPEGIKKLVPAVRSRISNKQAGSKTAKASNAMHEVINHAHVQIGMRIRGQPLGGQT